MSSPTVITYAKFNPSNIVLFPSFELFNTVRGYNSESQKNLKSNKVKGILSNNSAKKMRKLVYAWIFSVEAELERLRLPSKKRDQYISFITLTLPSDQMHTDYELKRDALNLFLITLQRKFNVSAYLWKAESQNNGNIHFHILVNQFIKWEKVRSIWNGILEPLGYIENFYKKHGHRDPNSTDIHGLYQDKKGKKIGDIGAYLAKYMSKNEDLKRGVKGRLWGCSDNLKKVEFFKIMIDGNWPWRDFLRDLNDLYHIEKTEKEYFLLLSGSYFKLLRTKYPELYKEFQNHYRNEFNKLYRVDT